MCVTATAKRRRRQARQDKRYKAKIMHVTPGVKQTFLGKKPAVAAKKA